MTPTPYRVLARKYRPSRVEDLIGQEPMVQTLRNAFALKRIHQAYLLSGVRGVGKTTTARILARAFNYETSEIHEPSLDMPELGIHCQAIIESHHMDVIEMDAASHTGVNDIRELIENARFRPLSARYKVYIIDEVHMLSKSAFDALLKTLEEPPDHVKFLFATTESDKIPTTIRSRCQRFDLRRIETDMLTHFLSDICKKEEMYIEEAALTLIARAAEGSVRDALSLLDQAMAHASSKEAPLDAEHLRQMLGLLNRHQIYDLFTMLIKGDMQSTFALVTEQYNQGIDLVTLLTDLASYTHILTGLKVAPDLRLDTSMTIEEQQKARDLASQLSMATLTRNWQMLSKGIIEVKEASRPLAATHMVLIRLAYAANLPAPDQVIRALLHEQEHAITHQQAMPPAHKTQVIPQSSSPTFPKSLQDCYQLAQEKRDIQLAMAIEKDMRLIRFEGTEIEIALTQGASSQILQTLSQKLQEWTSTPWKIIHVETSGAPTLYEVAEKKEAKKRTGIQKEPLVSQTLNAFPNADIVAIRLNEEDTSPLIIPTENDILFAENDDDNAQDDI